MPERHRSSGAEYMLYTVIILISAEEATSSVELNFPRTVRPYSSLLHNAWSNLVYDAGEPPGIGTPARSLYKLVKHDSRHVDSTFPGESDGTVLLGVNFNARAVNPSPDVI